MTACVVAGGGLILLVWIAVFIGTAMDTRAQRREWQRVARERQALAEQVTRRPLELDGLCADCPLRADPS